MTSQLPSERDDWRNLRLCLLAGSIFGCLVAGLAGRLLEIDGAPRPPIESKAPRNLSLIQTFAPIHQRRLEDAMVPPIIPFGIYKLPIPAVETEATGPIAALRRSLKEEIDWTSVGGPGSIAGFDSNITCSFGPLSTNDTVEWIADDAVDASAESMP